jgi:hypothetical protein
MAGLSAMTGAPSGTGAESRAEALAGGRFSRGLYATKSILILLARAKCRMEHSARRTRWIIRDCEVHPSRRYARE